MPLNHWIKAILAALLGALVAVGLLLLTPPAMGQTPAIKITTTPTTAPGSGPAIAPSDAPTDDARIAQRIRGIYSEIEALRPVQVRVAAGVVTLTGTVKDADAIAQAEGIASRVSGVVTVQNRLQRNLAVDSNLNPALAGVKDKANELLRLAPLIGVAILVAFTVGWIGYFIARRRKLWNRLAPNPFLAEVIATAIRFAFVISGIVLALDIVGATALLGAVLGAAGVIGIALGFAVRDTIDNYVSSLMLSVRHPFRANDSVSIDGKEGRVVRLTSRATILITPDGNHLRIPNSTVFKAVIVNFTSNPQRRFQFDVTVDAHADCGCAIAAALQALKGEAFVLASPEPKVEIVDQTAVPDTVLRCYGWVDQTRSDLGKSRTVAVQAVTDALRDGGFAVGQPVYRLRMERDEEQAAPATAPRTTPGESRDVSPENHVAAMVAEERASKKDGKDLLDSSRPTE